jgi:hypothetical protein
MTLYHDTRESWLLALVEGLRDFFADHELTIPSVHVSCSWASQAPRKTLGQCFHGKAAKDGARNLFITPSTDNAFEVAEIVAHELAHACLPDGTAHKGPFVKAIRRIGLEGKPTSTHAGPDLAKRLNTVLEDLGDYPHSAVSLTDQEKKQGTRLLKLQCPGCGYIVRATAKWIDTGLPTCCCGEEFKESET